MTVYNLQLVVNLNNNQIKSPNVFAVFLRHANFHVNLAMKTGNVTASHIAAAQDVVKQEIIEGKPRRAFSRAHASANWPNSPL